MASATLTKIIQISKMELSLNQKGYGAVGWSFSSVWSHRRSSGKSLSQSHDMISEFASTKDFWWEVASSGNFLATGDVLATLRRLSGLPYTLE